MKRDLFSGRDKLEGETQDALHTFINFSKDKLMTLYTLKEILRYKGDIPTVFFFLLKQVFLNTFHELRVCTILHVL